MAGFARPHQAHNLSALTRPAGGRRAARVCAPHPTHEQHSTTQRKKQANKQKKRQTGGTSATAAGDDAGTAEASAAKRRAPEPLGARFCLIRRSRPAHLECAGPAPHASFEEGPSVVGDEESRHGAEDGSPGGQARVQAAKTLGLLSTLGLDSSSGAAGALGERSVPSGSLESAAVVFVMSPQLGSAAAFATTSGTERSLLVPEGIRNVGNTCYAGAILQLLRAAPELRQALCGLVLDPAHHLVALELLALLDSTPSELGPADPTSLLIAIGNRNFAPGAQQDAHEFLVLLLHTLAIELPTPRGPTDTVISLLFGVTVSTVVERYHSGADHSSARTDAEQTTLSVSLHHGCTTVEMLLALQERTPSETDCPEPGCAARIGSTRLSLEGSACPPLVLVHIKRFDERRQRLDWPALLEPSFDATSVGFGGDFKYNISAVVCHQGDKTLARGHFVCYVRLSDRSWVLCDDSKCSPVSAATVFCGADVMHNVYIVLYGRGDGAQVPYLDDVRRADLLRALCVRAGASVGVDAAVCLL